MKKIMLLFLSIIICFTIVIYNKYKEYYNDRQEYCYKLNQIIKDYSFFKGEVKNNNIILYDNNNKIITKIKLDGSENVNIKYIRKDDNRIFFVFSGSVDDDNGIVFINDNKNSVLDGIYNLNRLGGNSYWYSTSP